jgi:hypothetical protein
VGPRGLSTLRTARAIAEETMAFTLVSNSFKEGETLAMDYILSADYGFGCGGNKSPASYIRPVRAQDRQTRAECCDLAR